MRSVHVEYSHGVQQVLPKGPAAAQWGCRSCLMQRNYCCGCPNLAAAVQEQSWVSMENLGMSSMTLGGDAGFTRATLGTLRESSVQDHTHTRQPGSVKRNGTVDRGCKAQAVAPSAKSCVHVRRFGFGRARCSAGSGLGMLLLGRFMGAIWRCSYNSKYRLPTTSSWHTVPGSARKCKL